LNHIPTKKVIVDVNELSPNNLLENRTALITGGTSGIGLEIAKSYLRAGAFVVITGRKQAKLDAVVQRIKTETGLDNVHGSILDVCNPEVFDMFLLDTEKAIDRRIDILVNNAGVIGGHISSCTVSDFDLIVNTNLRGTFFMTRSFANLCIAEKRKANILNIASSSSYRPADNVYSLTKWGIKGFTKGMAVSLAKYGIIVNAIAPGPTATPMLKPQGDDNLYIKNSLLGRFIIPEEIANAAVLMVSRLAQPLLGEILCMTGGAGNVSNKDVTFDFIR
jgi:NAD(P)-dependent dehydrogenase (short-subunit alcohol dehydrogenase family)